MMNRGMPIYGRAAIRIAIRTAAATAILLMAGSIAAILIFRSGWFHERVRERIIAEIEASTGGRVELGDFAFDWERLTATVSPLVLHGNEPAGDPPLLRVRSATLGLRVIAMFERKVDLAFVRVEQPVAHVVFYPGGNTNLPTPRARASQSWADDLLELRAGRVEIDDGVVNYDDRVIPLSWRGEDLRIRMSYDPLKILYRGEIAFRRTRVMPSGFGPIELDAAGGFAFDKSRIEISQLRLSTRDSRAELSGTMRDVRSPHGVLNVKSAISMRDAAAMFPSPAARTGATSLTGRVGFYGQLAISLARPYDFTLAGRASAQGLGCVYRGVAIRDATARANLSVTRSKLALDAITLTARGAAVTGTAQLFEWRDFHFDGNFNGLTLAGAAEFVTARRLPWSGNLAGSVTADAVLGQPDAKLSAVVSITSAGEKTGIEGQLDLTYDQASGAIRLGDSHVALLPSATGAATRIDASGTLGESLNLRVRSTNLDDLLPALAFIDEKAVDEKKRGQLPVKLDTASKDRRAEFEGTISGVAGTEDKNDPHLRGQVTLAAASLDGHPLDRLSAQVDATRREVHLTRLTARRGAAEIEGDASIAARNGSFDDASIAAQLELRNARIEDLAKEFQHELKNEWKLDESVSGTLHASLRVSGSLQHPDAEIAADIDKAAGFGEHLDRVRATVRYSPDLIDVKAGEAEGFSGTLRFEGSFQHRAGDWSNGDLRFGMAAQGVTLARIGAFSKRVPNLDATVDGKADGIAKIVRNELVLTSIGGDANAHGVISNQQPVGDATLHAETHGSDLAMRGTAKNGGLSAEAEGSWRLSGDDPGSATVRFSRASASALQSVLMAGGPLAQTELPFEGFIDGARATVSISLRKPEDVRAEVTIDQVQVNAKPAQTLRLGVQAPELVVRNSKPLTLEITAKEARIRSAEFTARDTSLEVTGAVPLDGAAGAGLTVRGSVNLIILQLLNPDLVARGNATVQASIRGALRDPQLNGRIELKNASLYLSDLPNGVDNANGSLVFDRNRATIEKLTAETGGGVVRFSGFIGFGSTLVYRLQAVADKVRVRYPEDVSVTFNATLALNGTSDASTVSGIIKVIRASFTPRADFAQVLAQVALPAASSATSQYVRGTQFDVRIESGPNFEFQTSLTRNLEAAVALRLRGTPLQPALLGSISVNDGEMQIFGNRYTVNRGDIRFLNPVRIDPIFDMDLETKARGVTVNISIAGTTQKLNVNYSSDPPMQPREIIALLAVGRTPTETAGLNSEPASSANSASLSDAGSSLISQAISAQLSSRLQRFFGASRVKFDPALAGADYLPQARLTIEQPVSQDLTLTYITNLNRTEEQIVQIEWDFNRKWSAVAVREASGLFGIDIQYRKRFK